MNREEERRSIYQSIESVTDSYLYSSIRKGYKVNISKSINEECREHLIYNEWVIDVPAIESIFNNIINNRYLVPVIESSSDEDVEQLEGFLKHKISLSLRDFKYQSPTTSQVYRYVEACNSANVKFHRISHNVEIWQETERIENLLKSETNTKGETIK